MSQFIVSEDFVLSPAIKERAERHIGAIREQLHDDSKVSVFLKKVSAKDYSAHYQVRFLKKDLVVDFRGPDLYKNMDKAVHKLIFLIHELKKQKQDNKRKAVQEFRRRYA